MADKFVRVRLTRIDDQDLNLFEFDYDLTFMVFFLDAEEHVYARYGGRDGKDADRRQSLPGLHYTMQSVLDVHARRRQVAERAAAEEDFAPKSQDKPKYIRDIAGGRGGFGGRGCMHCHQVREALDRQLTRDGKWSRDQVWRYPLPENVGMTLEVDRGNIVKSVAEKTPAAALGIKPGDVVRRLNGVPIHSFGDAQFALDKAPKAGTISISWQRDGKTADGTLALADGWRKTEIAWRTSMRGHVPYPRVGGKDLNADERKALGLSPKQLAFRQRDTVSAILKEVGIQAGDVILGFDDQKLEMTVDEFIRHVQNNYLVGDKVTINLLRGGQRHNLPMTLRR